MFEIRNGSEVIGADRDASVASIQQATGRRVVWIRPPREQAFFKLENDKRLASYEHRRDLHNRYGEKSPLVIERAS